MIRKSLAAAALCLFLAINTSSQSANATVSGTITDVTGGLMQGVTVTAINTQTGIVTVVLSNKSGTYNFAGLQPGVYELSASQPGFDTENLRDLPLGSAQYEFKFTLQVATVTNAIEVSTPTDALMAASSSSVGDVLTEFMIQRLPLVGNDALSFLRMLPGVAMEDDRLFGMMPTLSFAGVGQISVNTTRDGISVSDARYNNGADASTRLNPDMVGEIRLLLSPVDAEFGRGNSQVQIQTRSGTNRYSGSATWNILNSAFAANTWTNNSTVDPLTGQWKPTPPNWYNNHQYTLSYGGPIVKNKTFFFALWDQQINYQRNLVTASVMTDTARQGIFRYFERWNPGHALTPIPALPANANTGIYPSVDLAGNPVAPLTNPDGTPYASGLRCFSVFGNVKFDGTPFTAADCPGGTAQTNSVPWDSRRPVADPTGYIRKILDKMPPANFFGIGDGLNQAAYRWVRPRHGNENAFVFTGADPSTDRKQINVKIDENFSANYRLSLGWSSERNDSEFDTPNWPGALSNVTKRYPQVITANFTSVLSANLFNEARFGLRRQKADVVLPWESDRLREEAMGYTIAGSNGYFAVVNPGIGNYAFGGSSNGVMNVSTFNQGSVGNSSPLYTYADALSWTMGKHAFKVGGELRFARSKAYSPAPQNLAYPRVAGGPGGNVSPLAGVLPGLPNRLQASRTNVSQMQYFLAGSVNNASMLYWIDDPSDVTNGVWEDVRTKGRKYRDQRQEEWAVFWKDDWKFTHNLTLNIGLRYEYYGSPYISSGFASTPADQGDGLWGAFRGGGGNPFERWLSPGNVYLTGYGPNVAAADALKCAPPACDPNTLTTIEFVGPNSTNPGKRVIPADRNNFAPAVGFAWRLPWFGEGKTTVRGGYQITYGGSFGATGIPIGFGTDIVIASAPGSTSAALLQNYIGEFSGQYLDLTSVPLLVPVRPTNPAKPGRQLDISASSSSVDFHAYDARYATPYVQNFNLSITRTLRSNLSLDLRYIGTVSRKQAGQINLNTPNVYHNKELLEALEITRAGGNAPLFDQMLAGLNLNNGVTGYGPVGTSVGGVLQTGSAHLRRNATFAPHLANGNFAEVANLLNGNGPATPAVGAPGGLLSLPQGFTGTAGGRLLRNGCDRMAAGQTTFGTLRCFPEDYIRANPQLANSFLETNSASSNYHSMQAQIMLRPAGGAMYMGTYTWSKNLGIPGMILPIFGTAGPDYTDPSDRKGDYTFTNSHRTHDFRGSASFEVPAGPGRRLLGNSSGLLARFVEGWRTSFIFGFSSGAHADVSSSYFFVDTFLPTGLYGASVPDVVRRWPSVLNGQVRWDGDNGSYFDSSFINVEDPQCAGVTTADNLRNFCTLGAVADSFSGEIVLQNPKPGTRGNLGQRRVTLPGTWNLDANIAKTIQISESGWIKSLQLRVDATNVLNHSTPLWPDFNINSGSPFGLIAGKSDQVRAFQGQVRVQF